MKQQLEGEGYSYTDYMQTEKYCRATWSYSKDRQRKLVLPFIKVG
jgi:hypothetical protein